MSCTMKSLIKISELTSVSVRAAAWQLALCGGGEVRGWVSCPCIATEKPVRGLGLGVLEQYTPLYNYMIYLVCVLSMYISMVCM